MPAHFPRPVSVAWNRTAENMEMGLVSPYVNRARDEGCRGTAVGAGR